MSGLFPPSSTVIDFIPPAALLAILARGHLPGKRDLDNTEYPSWNSGFGVSFCKNLAVKRRKFTSLMDHGVTGS